MKKIALFCAVFALTLAACGGGAKEGAAPATPSKSEPVDLGPEPKTAEEAQGEIARDRDQITASRGGTSGGSASVSTPTSQSITPSAGGEAKPHDRVQANECASLCRAIASMRRAKAALCRITGDSDPRCTEAQKTLDESEKAVSYCGC